jgi:hypothetical protein
MNILKSNSKFPRWFLVLTAVVFIAAATIVFNGCKTVQDEQPPVDNGGGENENIDEAQLLDDTFRIDIKTIAVTYDYWPEAGNIDCRAVVTFQMRDSQVRPLIHFDPAVRSPELIGAIRLNGELLDLSNPSDIQTLSFEGSTQQALEFQRDLAANTDYTLEVEYDLIIGQGNYPRFSVDVNDIVGRGNEEIFPTLNTPHELARHVLTFRIRENIPYRCIGSGLVEPINTQGIQEWQLDTQREVASYTVMFVLMPWLDMQYDERIVNGVDVRIMAFLGGPSIDEAFDRLELWLPQLEADLGPFPMPRLSIFLVSVGGGMEYYGGTITSLGALEHEIFHMYYGCSTVAGTYRDTWLDEAVNEWYEHSVDPAFQPISSDYRSNMVSGRTPIAVGFDRRAYYEGARIIQAAAREMGGRNAMIGFLQYLHQNYSFSPFNTFDFLDYLEDYSGVHMHDRFLEWLYNGEQTYYSSESDPLSHANKKEVDMTPPPDILRKYTDRYSDN